MIRHAYHVYAGGVAWRDAVQDHLDALRHGGLADELLGIHVGLVGPAPARHEALDVISEVLPVTIIGQADEGWEQVTLSGVRELARYAWAGDQILYAHTKGAANISEINTAWRKSMSYWNVVKWRDAAGHLSVADTAGCHWIPEGRFFGGNYWWAQAEYLATLPPPDYASRYMAEVWIGHNPDVISYDMVPGCPAFDRFTTTWT